MGELLRAAGKAQEGEKLFMEVHPWVSWEGILAECMVGVLGGEGEGWGEGDGEGNDGEGIGRVEGQSLEDMD